MKMDSGRLPACPGLHSLRKDLRTVGLPLIFELHMSRRWRVRQSCKWSDYPLNEPQLSQSVKTKRISDFSFWLETFEEIKWTNSNFLAFFLSVHGCSSLFTYPVICDCITCILSLNIWVVEIKTIEKWEQTGCLVRACYSEGVSHDSWFAEMQAEVRTGKAV